MKGQPIDETGMTSSQQQKLEVMIDYTVRRILSKKMDKPYTSYGHENAELKRLATMVTRVFNQNIAKLLEVISGLSIATVRWTLQEQKQAHLAGMERDRKERRIEVTKSLRSARGRLSHLHRKINIIEKKLIPSFNAQGIRNRHAEQLKDARRRLQAIRDKTVAELLQHPKDLHYELHRAHYTSVPLNFVQPSLFADNIPSVPGIYFLWENGIVDYVGQSVCLKNRLRLGSHHVLHAEHQISFVQAHEVDLDWTECFYIGICKPDKNFGMRRDRHRPHKMIQHESETA